MKTFLKLNKSSFFSILPRTIKVQLLKFIERDFFDSMIIRRKFPQIPINETINIYGNEICVIMFKAFRIISGCME